MGRSLGPYGRLARWVFHRRRLVLLSVLLFTLAMLPIGLPPNVDTNILALMPADDPAAVATRQLHDEEGGANLLSLTFQHQEEGESEKAQTYLDDLCAELQALEEVQFAVHRIDPDLAFRLGLMQLEPGDVKQLNARLRGALALGPALNPIVLQRLMELGPVTDRIASAHQRSLFGVEDGRSRILVRPTGSSHDPSFAVGLMKNVNQIIDASDPAAAGLDLVWMGGAYRHNVEDYKGIQQDILRMGLASAVLVLLAIAFFFRSWRATVLVFAPILMAYVSNMALVEVTFGHLNTYTSMAGALLIGLGIDFAVHLVGRYREQRALGMDVQEAIEASWDLTGPPCTTAALTSAAGFLALAMASFQGFSQLGVVLAIGLVFSLALMLVVLPALIPMLDPAPKQPLIPQSLLRKKSRSTYRLAPIGLMVAVLVTAMLGGARLPLLGTLNYDLSTMRREGLSYTELIESERELAQQSYSPVVVSYPDGESLRKAQENLKRAMSEGALPHVRDLVSIENFLPSDQVDRVATLQDLARLMRHPNLRYLHASAARPMVDALMPLRELQPRTLKRSDLPDALLVMLGASSAEHHRLLLLPDGNMWDLRESEALLTELERAIPDRPVAGEYTATGSMYRLVRADMPMIVGLAFVLVMILTTIDLRRPAWIGSAVGTIVIGMIWAGIAVQAVGERLSIVNFVGIPILFGIGVDVVIHLLHRLAEEGPGGVRRALATTGVAATISTVTTVLSFLSLTLAGNRGIRSIGTLVVIGLLTVFVTTAVFLPLAWAAGWRLTDRVPADLPEEDP